MYNFTLHLDVMYAINNHNNLIPGDKLTFLDGALICFIKSFQDHNQKFFVSNKELSKIFVANESTIQRSINRLTKLGLIRSEKSYINQTPRRYLTYDKSKLQELLNLT
jgi:DNA-binding MarR family transcriptional regulator